MQRDRSTRDPARLELKRCSACAEVKRVEDFYVSRGRLSSYCKDCQRQASRRAYRRRRQDPGCSRPDALRRSPPEAPGASAPRPARSRSRAPCRAGATGRPAASDRSLRARVPLPAQRGAGRPGGEWSQCVSCTLRHSGLALAAGMPARCQPLSQPSAPPLVGESYPAAKSADSGGPPPRRSPDSGAWIS
jgi:hypothetical protein